eukprot:m.80320 g.80320  ORF g.80320 m.80320 type:complete len:102 (-) comp12752_c0_seq1:2342-2647(-)
MGLLTLVYLSESQFYNKNILIEIQEKEIVGKGCLLPHSIPAFTAGGNSEALMATPTKPPAFPAVTDIATPTPEGTAMPKPTASDIGSPREVMNSVGQPHSP